MVPKLEVAPAGRGGLDLDVEVPERWNPRLQTQFLHICQFGGVAQHPGSSPKDLGPRLVREDAVSLEEHRQIDGQLGELVARGSP